MQKDFHYYATYAAAYLAGYSHKESLAICFSDQFVDECTETYLTKLRAPRAAATTQLQLELADARTDVVGLQNMTRIWASFHFLPGDLYAKARGSKRYKQKYRMICNPNSDLLVETVNLVKDKSLQAAGIAMHILSDTWAHRYFAGTPSLVINNTNNEFFEIMEDGTEKRISFRHNPTAPDDLDNSAYTNSIFQFSENSIMNLGHGRAGHLPDYSFVKYRYLPAWNEYQDTIKDNPSDYMHAFCQMVYALKFLRGEVPTFEKEVYDETAVLPHRERIDAIFRKRQLDSCDDWKAFGEELSGKRIPDFDVSEFENEYLNAVANRKDETFFGKFVIAAMAQKSMVTNKIYKSGNLLAGYSIDYNEKGFRGMKEYAKLVEASGKDGEANE